jgi:hypothetical protein
MHDGAVLKSTAELRIAGWDDNMHTIPSRINGLLVPKQRAYFSGPAGDGFCEKWYAHLPFSHLPFTQIPRPY